MRVGNQEYKFRRMQTVKYWARGCGPFKGKIVSMHPSGIGRPIYKIKHLTKEQYYFINEVHMRSLEEIK